MSRWVAPERIRLAGPSEGLEAGGGLYNPGAWHDPIGDNVWLLLRRERAYPFIKRPSVPPVVAFVTPTGLCLSHTVSIIGHHADARLEDFRPILHRGQVIVAHTIARDDGIKPGLSILEGTTLTRWDDLNLPIALAPVEKNWVLASDGETLFLVYSLDPLVVFARLDGAINGGWWRRLFVEPTHWTSALGKPPRNSCNLVPFDGGWLGWWHIVLDQWYVQGAYWLDASFTLRARTGVLFDGQDVRDGFKPGVLYLSSQVLREAGGTISLYFGEGDAYSSTCTVGMDAVRDALRLEGR